ncbi:MAG TPA: SGNH/GDSL hydrolase family protein [Candidatus Polarisedimenticolia bacterium]|jgi:lysophospholipase L1-like esterase
MRRNLLLSAVVVVLFFGLLEAVLRLSGRVSSDALRSPNVETLDAIPGLFDPGQDLVDRILPELPYHIHINSLGFRGREFPLRKEPGTLRVLCLGDSYTFGHHVADEEAFPAVLDRLLNEATAKAGRRVEVINAGANGFTIVDELSYLNEKGLALEPDIVVLAFSQNDISDLKRERPSIELMREHARLKSTFVLGPIIKLLQHTAIFNAMQRSAAWIEIKRRPERSHPLQEDVDPALWRRYGDLLGEVNGLVRRHEVEMLLVVWPSWRQVDGIDPLDPQGKLALLAKERGIDLLDLTPVLKELQSSGVKAFLVPLDGHPSVRGQEAGARAIAARLTARIASRGESR